ncbi:MAG: DUF4340 domain-containing protein [Anaerolineae bacterium]
MNWRTTAALLIVLIALGGYVYYQDQQEPEPPPIPTAVAAPPAREPLFPGATINGVEQLEVTRREDGLMAIFVRDETGEWTRTVPTTTLVISQTLNTQVTGLINTSSTQRIAADANPLSVYGLDNPAYEIALTVTRTDGKLVRYTLRVGNEVPTGNNFYIQRKGDGRMHVVPSGSIQNMINLLETPPLAGP